MRKPALPSNVPSAMLEAQGHEALQQGRFKAAVEAFKQLIKREPRPDWRKALDDAYAGYARSLAGKGMFKEATIVLDNTRAADGTVREPVLYLLCLVRQGQHDRAGRFAAKHVGGEAASQTELAAALSLLAPPSPGDGQVAPTDWVRLCRAAAEALAGWVEGVPAEEVDRRLDRIPLRSPFKPLRLILKSLITSEAESARAARLLDMISADSVFAPFCEAAKAALSGDIADLLGSWHRLRPAQQAFVGAVRGVPDAELRRLGQMTDAERQGPAALLAFLLRQVDRLPAAELRQACLDLLPQSLDHIPHFERRFGALSEFDRARIQALAAEAAMHWWRAQECWLAAAEALEAVPGDRSRLERAVIYRHVAEFPASDLDPMGDGDAVAACLEQSVAADPDHLDTALTLIRRYQEIGRSEDWHRAVEAARRRFPEEIAVLGQAVDSAVARKAYKKAAKLARKLLQLDPINQAARQRMIELQLAYGRKQMRADRPDLAAKALTEAAEWERADAPSGPLRIGRAIVELARGEAAEGPLREGVALVGVGPVGWFRALLEADLMDWGIGFKQRFRRDLAGNRDAPPRREGILALVAMLGQQEIRDSPRIVEKDLEWIRPWLLRGQMLAWTSAELLILGERFEALRAFDLLQGYARQALERNPDDPLGRYYRIVAKCAGDPSRLLSLEERELGELAEQAAEARDFHLANRIDRFIDRPEREDVSGFPGGLSPDDDPTESMIQSMVERMLVAELSRNMPKDIARDIQDNITRFGTRRATEMLAAALQGMTADLDVDLLEGGYDRVAAALVERATKRGAGRGR